MANSPAGCVAAERGAEAVDVEDGNKVGTVVAAAHPCPPGSYRRWIALCKQGHDARAPGEGGREQDIRGDQGRRRGARRRSRCERGVVAVSQQRCGCGDRPVGVTAGSARRFVVMSMPGPDEVTRGRGREPVVSPWSRGSKTRRDCRCRFDVAVAGGARAVECSVGRRGSLGAPAVWARQRDDLHGAVFLCRVEWQGREMMVGRRQ